MTGGLFGTRDTVNGERVFGDADGAGNTDIMDVSDFFFRRFGRDAMHRVSTI